MKCTCDHPISFHSPAGKCEAFGCPCPESAQTAAYRETTVVARPRFLTPQEVAARYDCTLDWVYHCKALTPFKRKIGGKLRFLESDLVLFEDSRDGARYGLTKQYLMRHRHKYEQEHPLKTILKFEIK